MARRRNNHLRVHYESLLTRLSIESGLLIHQKLSTMSDYQLLSLINFRLDRLGCETHSKEELEMDLI